MRIRRATHRDNDAIARLNTRTFDSTAESEILRRLHQDNDDVLSLVKYKGSKLIGHIQFYRIFSKDQEFVGLGPLSVHPDYQRKGHGSKLVKQGLMAVKSVTTTPLIFVLGHPRFYPKFGFSSEVAKSFSAPWQGESFMAVEIRSPAPHEGVLEFPKAFL